MIFEKQLITLNPAPLEATLMLGKYTITKAAVISKTLLILIRESQRTDKRLLFKGNRLV